MEGEMSKGRDAESSMSEKPISRAPRRLADWLNPTGERKVHSLVDKIYKTKNLEMAWQRVKANKGAGGIDGQTIDDFEANVAANLRRLHDELKSDSYRPQPVRQKMIPKPGQPDQHRSLGIPTIYDRVCQQAILNRIEPIFERVFDDASFGYRKGRSAKDALRKVWKEIHEGNAWIVDADLRDFFGSVSHEKLLTLVNQRISDGRVLRLIEAILQAGCIAEGTRIPTEHGTPQGGVISPCLSNVLLTPFDREMRRRGYNVTRYADDWVATCRSRAEAKALLETAKRILEKLGVTLHPAKTRIVNVRHGFEFLGYKIKRGNRPMQLRPGRIRSSAKEGAVYALPRAKSVKKFMDQIRRRTRRRRPLSTQDLIDDINPVIRGWGNYFCKAHVRKIFHRLDAWIVRRLWSHRYKRWRCGGWKTLPGPKLYGEMGLVNLVELIPSIGPHDKRALAKAGCGKTARPV
jgi:group II intron reverse transcriptase/maturase